jgi:hypothetical protein
MTNQTAQKKALKIIEIQKQLDEMKPLYKEIDELVCELVAANVTTVEVKDQKVIILDNFSDKNTVFRTTGVKRYEAKIEKKAA